MAYIKTNWVNNETPISANNLNKIENQLEANANNTDNNTNDILSLKYNLITDGDPIKTGRKIDGQDEYVKRITLDSFPSTNQTKSWDTGIIMTNAIITNLVVMAKSGSNNWFSLPNNDTINSRVGLNNDGKIYIEMFTGNLNGQNGYAEIYYYITE